MLFLRDPKYLFLWDGMSHKRRQAELSRLADMFFGLRCAYFPPDTPLEQSPGTFTQVQASKIDRVILTFHSLATDTFIENNPETGPVNELIH